jgi:hypothetical protein
LYVQACAFHSYPASAANRSARAVGPADGELRLEHATDAALAGGAPLESEDAAARDE